MRERIDKTSTRKHLGRYKGRLDFHDSINAVDHDLIERKCLLRPQLMWIEVAKPPHEHGRSVPVLFTRIVWTIDIVGEIRTEIVVETVREGSAARDNLSHFLCASSISMYQAVAFNDRIDIR